MGQVALIFFMLLSPHHRHPAQPFQLHMEAQAGWVSSVSSSDSGLAAHTMLQLKPQALPYGSLVVPRVGLGVPGWGSSHLPYQERSCALSHKLLLPLLTALSSDPTLPPDYYQLSALLP